MKRIFLLKKELYQLIDRLLYQKQSHFLLHYWNAHRCPYESVLFYNFFGRIVFAAKEVIALLSSNRVFSKSIMLDGYDAKEEQWENGRDMGLWPRTPFVEDGKVELEEAFFEQVERALSLANSSYHDSLDKTADWEVVRQKFQVLLFDDDATLQKEALINFRQNGTFEKVIADTFEQVDVTSSYKAAYLKAIDLVLEYHRNGAKVKKEILASLSESHAGNSACVYYRGLRLSEKLLFYATLTNDIVANIPFRDDKRDVIMDIGTGYGGLPVILKRYIPNACYILVDFPEVLAYASYFVKYNFPDKNIALLDDIVDKFDQFDRLIEQYDFIILPSNLVEKIPTNAVDVVMNTASLGFLSQEYLDYYIHHINRCLRKGGYFYSVNKMETCKWGVGLYACDFRESYLTLSFEYNNRFSYPQWLGKKID